MVYLFPYDICLSVTVCITKNRSKKIPAQTDFHIETNIALPFVCDFTEEENYQEKRKDVFLNLSQNCKTPFQTITILSLNLTNLNRRLI